MNMQHKSFNKDWAAAVQCETIFYIPNCIILNVQLYQINGDTC